MNNLTKIYGLIDPRNGMISYIGKTNQKLSYRLNAHLNCVKRSDDFSKRKGWIKHLIAKKFVPSIELIDEVPIDEWEFWEKHYIKLFKSFGAKLYNSTDGGNTLKKGIYIKSANARRGKKIPREQVERMAAKCRGQKRTEHTKMLMSISQKKLNRKNIPQEHLRKPVTQYDLNGNFIKEWAAITFVGHSGSNIKRSCDRNLISLNSYWRYGTKLENGEKIIIPIKLIPCAKPILKMSKENVILNEFYSASEAARKLNLTNHGNISACCRGRRKTAYGFKWKYKN